MPAPVMEQIVVDYACALGQHVVDNVLRRLSMFKLLSRIFDHQHAVQTQQAPAGGAPAANVQELEAVLVPAFAAVAPTLLAGPAAGALKPLFDAFFGHIASPTASTQSTLASHLGAALPVLLQEAGVPPAPARAAQ